MTGERYRITDDAHVYFVTYNIVEWLPVFVSEMNAFSDRWRIFENSRGGRSVIIAVATCRNVLPIR